MFFNNLIVENQDIHFLILHSNNYLFYKAHLECINYTLRINIRVMLYFQQWKPHFFPTIKRTFFPTNKRTFFPTNKTNIFFLWFGQIYTNRLKFVISAVREDHGRPKNPPNYRDEQGLSVVSLSELRTSCPTSQQSSQSKVGREFFILLQVKSGRVNEFLASLAITFPHDASLRRLYG